MSSLTPREKRKLEDLFGMSSGYVLDFSNNTFARFFEEEVGRNIYGGTYEENGSSKANHLRSFWTREGDVLVGQAINGLLEHCRDTENPAVQRQSLFNECELIAARLVQAKDVPDVEVLDGDTEDFQMVAKAARECFHRNEPEQGLDRLHTFLVKFLRKLCDAHGIPRDRTVPLGGLMGAYVKRIREEGLLTSQMAEHILKGTISIFGQFDHVRNNHSMAHDNPVLDHDEALLIASSVTSTVRFIKSCEQRWEAQARSFRSRADRQDLDIPF
ncbi:abortive infection family protein [Stenotrophomonas sp. PS02289]|uniref:abortive infection family protein n=1 Tax=Stenotrophomonas sp. PS02289 TaxID=2991422 RepID=UPI00249C0987|nr:abortive infection family protein [Stenotrophomonas sp. PS02289]